MTGKIPKRPTGQSPEADFQKVVYENIVNEQRMGMVSGQGQGVTTQGRFILPSRSRGGGSGASATQFKLRFVEDDYLVCREFDGTTLGATDIYIAKIPDLKCSDTSRDVYGETHTYIYEPDSSEPFMEYGDTVPDSDPEVNEWGESASDYDTGQPLFEKRLNTVRHVEADGITEDQRVITVWRKGEIIYGIEFDDGGTTTEGLITEAGKPIDFLMLHKREWARI